MTTTLLPLLAIAVISVVHYLLSYLGFYDFEWISTLFWSFASFSFGLTMNHRSKRSNTWVLKLIIAFVVFLLFTFQMGWISVPLLSNVRSNILLYFIYVWAGWAFFRN